MSDDYWINKWKDNDIRFHRGAAHPSLDRYFRKAPPGRVFVPLCGKSLDLLWLRSHGHRVFGVELSPIACEALFRENGIHHTRRAEGAFEVFEGSGIEIWCGDYFALPAKLFADVSAVYDRAALIALPPALRDRYAATMIERLRGSRATSIQMLLITVEYPDGFAEGPPFSVTQREVAHYYASVFRIEPLYREEDIGMRGHPRLGETAVFEAGYRLQWIPHDRE